MISHHTALAATFTVDSTGDGGDSNLTDGICNDGTGKCTLRAAIQQANSTLATDTIQFNIPGIGIQTITPGSALPTITNPVILDGTTQPGFITTPLIELDGSNAGPGVDGLRITAGNSTVKGLIINRFGGNGITLAFNGGNTITGNFIGVNATGVLAMGNAKDGIFINGVSNNTIGGTTLVTGNLISGNNSDGIEISGNGATNNIVQGNFIGTDLTGALDLGNLQNGIFINGASNNTLGGTTSGTGNLISGNNSHGIEISGSGATGNRVQGNFIGTNSTGTVALGNSGNGILISGVANNIIGGSTSGSGNVLSGNNLNGIQISGTGATGNQVQGNFIGTHINGSLALGNNANGILISNASNNTIGGTTLGAGNIISGNNSDGIEISGTGATNNQVQGNFIGTDISGLIILSNTGNGVLISNAFNNTIGGTAAGAGNLISGNNATGITISGNSATGNQVQGNLIGTNLGGSSALGNASEGILISSASNNTIGGTTSAARNIISGNTSHGITLSGSGTSGNLIQGNFIGTDSNGTNRLGNSQTGVFINGVSNNVIGGTATGAGNVISGNNSDGIRILSTNATGNLIRGNLIGVNVNGTVALSNGGNGIFINNAPGNTVGGTTSGARNVISGNNSDGIEISGTGATGNLIQGNYIGTDINGTAALANIGNGVFINGASSNTVGGTVTGSRNVISGNNSDGIEISGTGATGNLIQGNYIGLTSAGTATLGNAGHGVLLNDVANNTVGGLTVGERNIISGNALTGIAISGTGATGNLIQGNFIGTDSTGTIALGNTSHGVVLASSASNNTIGGTANGAGNVIAFNGSDGIFANSGTGNLFSRNSIFSNTDLGIDLGSNGVTLNDAGDGDTGANNLQNFPVLTSANSGGGGTTVQGTFNSMANTNFVLEFFSNSTCNASGNGEGATFLGSTTVITDSAGNANINITSTTVVPTGQFITATATDPNNNTSEFSNCIQVNRADLSVIKTDSPDPTTVNATLTYTIRVTNNGPSQATNVTLTDTLPSSVTFVSSLPGSPTCTPSGSTVTCNLGTLNSGAISTVTILVIPTSAGTITNTVSVTGGGIDPNPANNTETESTTVTSADLAITKSDSPDPVLIGSNLTYTLTVTNNGPFQATGVVVTDTLPASVILVSAPGCTQAGSTVTCNLGSINSGSSASVTIVVQPTTVGTISNTASVTSNTFDPTPANNTTTAQLTTVNPVVDLALTKTDSPDPATTTADLTYTLTVNNNGPSPATGVTLTDTLPSGVIFRSVSPTQGSCSGTSTITCNLGTISNGGSATVTIVVTPNTTTTLVNTASVTANETDSNTANNTATQSTAIVIIGLSVIQSDSPDPVAVGTDVTYTIRVINNSNSQATQVVLTDTLTGNFSFVSATSTQGTCSGTTTITCNIGTMNKGVVTITVKVNPTAVGTITSTATVTSNPPDSNLADNTAVETTTVTVTDLAITQSDSPDPVTVGANLTYTLVATNNGPSLATGVIVTDTLPVSVTYVSANSTQGTCSKGSGTVTCSLGNLANGASATINIVVTPITVGIINNTVQIAGNEADSNLSNNTSLQSTTITAADLSVTQTDSPDPIKVGNNLTYTLQVTNNGPSSAANVTLTDTLPVNVTFVSVTPNQGSCSVTTTVTCNLGTLTTGASATVSLIVQPTGAGAITNSASVSSSQFDPNTTNNTSSQGTTVDPTADLSVTQLDIPDPVTVGANLTYLLTVTNQGPSQATGVTLTDMLPPNITFVSVTTSQGNCSLTIGVNCTLNTLAVGATATVTILVKPPTAGTITNTVTVASLVFDPVLTNNTNSQNTEVTAANLTITSSDSPDPVTIGAGLTYTLQVTNNGPSAATGVTLTDILPVGVTLVSATPDQGSCTGVTPVSCALGTLNNGATATVTLVMNAPTATGTITNTATVASNEFDPNLSDNTTSQDTTVNPAADLMVTQSDSPDPVAVGNNVTYTITVTNNGPSVATGVTLTDTLPAGVLFVSATLSSGNCNGTGPVICSLGTLAKGASITIALVVKSTTTGSISNTVRITGNETDPNTANNSQITSTLVTLATDLAITQADSPDPVLVGTNLSYTITVINNGPSAATGVTLTDTLPSGMTFISATPSQGTCTGTSPVTCTLGILPVSATATVILVGKPTTTGSLVHTVSVANLATNETDPNLANNTATENTTVNPAADLAVSQLDSPDPVTIGNNITYTITVTNNGLSTATGVTLQDTLPAGATFVSITPGQGSCSGTGTINCSLGTLASGTNTLITLVVKPTLAGTLNNKVSVTANESDPDMSNNTGTADTTVNPAADLSIRITDSPDPVGVGINLTYTLTITNNGPSSATGITLVDTLPAGVIFISITPSQGNCNGTSTLTCNLGTLNSGAGATVVLIVKPQVLGILSHAGSVTGNEFDPNTVNNIATQTTTVTAFIVNSTLDPGNGVCDATECTLREAINTANATAGTDVILFNLPGAGPYTIQLISALPDIADPIWIDGTSQPGFTGTPLIELNGSSAGIGANGLKITAGNSIVKGLIINRFAGNGILITTGGGNLIQGNFIGTDVSGTTALGNGGTGIFINLASNNLIGGTTPGSGNVISGNGSAGIQIFGGSATGNRIQGNFVGTNFNGTVALGNAFDGIFLVNAPGNTLGGTTPGARNIISGNKLNGIEILGTGATGNWVQGNFIGTQADGIGPLGNTLYGVLINTSASNNTIGGTAPGAGNIIAFNGSDGIFIDSGIGNALFLNSIFSNSGLGIDLGLKGITSNDSGDGDSGANNLQNFPLLTSAVSSGGSTTVQGTLNSTPNTRFRVEFYFSNTCDPSGNGEGTDILGVTTLTTDGSGNASVNVTFPVLIPAGQVVTATVTDSNNNTSEFSPCVTVTLTPPPTPTPTATPTATPTPVPTPVITSIIWGISGDVPIPRDYNGDNKADITVWRPGAGDWFIMLDPPIIQPWGVKGDKLVPGDYDGDGKTDIAVFRPSIGTWFALKSSGGVFVQKFGSSSDIPAPEDYDGDGVTDLAVFRPFLGTWGIKLSSNPGNLKPIRWGLSGDIPVPADYDGDKKADVAVWRPAEGNWYISFSTGGSTILQLGLPGDIPVPADYDGDGKADLAVWRPGDGMWHITFSSTGLFSSTQWGLLGDIPVPADYDGDGKADLAVWRPGDGTWNIIFEK
ncbi:MAG TPA: FG-GAP-like repeat-containing protein [Candidatus Limnocylindrales bacterium]|nr:FG-GAP-like repeat-containing protein [Candidatus Limnocylindrales bacterium]